MVKVFLPGFKTEDVFWGSIVQKKDIHCDDPPRLSKGLGNDFG